MTVTKVRPRLLKHDMAKRMAQLQSCYVQGHVAIHIYSSACSAGWHQMLFDNFFGTGQNEIIFSAQHFPADAGKPGLGNQALLDASLVFDPIHDLLGLIICRLNAKLVQEIFDGGHTAILAQDQLKGFLAHHFRHERRNADLKSGLFVFALKIQCDLGLQIRQPPAHDGLVERDGPMRFIFNQRTNVCDPVKLQTCLDTGQPFP